MFSTLSLNIMSVEYKSNITVMVLLTVVAPTSCHICPSPNETLPLATDPPTSANPDAKAFPPFLCLKKKGTAVIKRLW